MASAWIQISPFVNRWFGSGVRSTVNRKNILDPPPEPDLFRPSDISGLQGWLDADDPSTIVTDSSGINVLSWANKGDLSGNFDLSGSADVQYGVNTVNGLNVVTFTPLSFMSGIFPLDFQDRSIFIVSRRTEDISGSLAWWDSDDSNGMTTVVEVDGTDFKYILKHNGSPPPIKVAFTTPIDTKNNAELVTFINSSTDLSGNYGGLNGIQQTLTNSQLADYNTSSITYYLGHYLDGDILHNTFDMCEILIYDSVLTADQQLEVEVYLQRKWRVKVPPVPPVPFAPTDLSGLQVWLDGANTGSLSLSGSDVLSWSNVGSAGGLFSQTNGVATYVSSSVSMPTGGTLDAYFSLPYYSRTLFAVVEPVGELSTYLYPYLNFMDGQASDARQAGLSYDSGGDTFNFTICQSGANCPIVAPFNPMPSGLLLVTGVVDSNDASNNAGYLNNGSNINTSADLGNLFNQNPVPYIIGSSNASGPEFRMAEFLEYDSVLSSGDISTVTSYLNTKWSLVSK